MPRLWLIDDIAHHHTVTASTVASVTGWEFLGFYTGAEAIRALGQAERDERPQVILVDYYIGHERGDQVAEALRAAEAADHRPVLIGFSSVRNASQCIVDAGADLILPKVANDAGINPHLLRYLQAWPSR